VGRGQPDLAAVNTAGVTAQLGCNPQWYLNSKRRLNIASDAAVSSEYPGGVRYA
jgi:hypothetical protein